MSNMEKVIEQTVADMLREVSTLEDITDDRDRARVMKSIQRLTNKLDKDVRDYIPGEIQDAYEEGYDSSGSQLIRAGRPVENQLNENVHVEAIREITDDSVLDMQAAIRRARESGMTEIESRLQEAQNLIAQGMLEGSNRKTVTKAVMENFSENGLTSFITRDGKRLPLDFYGQTVVRTKLKKANTDASVNRYIENGVLYGQTNEHTPTCKVCASRQGVIFRLTDEGDPSIPHKDEIGLPPYHPNCRHSLRPITSLEGRTIKPYNPERDPRSAYQQRAYEKEQAIRRKANQEKKDYNRLRETMGDDAPATLGAYRRMKRRNDDSWNQLQDEFRSVSENVKAAKPINPAVNYARTNRYTQLPDSYFNQDKQQELKPETILSREYLPIDANRRNTKNGQEYELEAFGKKGTIETTTPREAELVENILSAGNREGFRQAFYEYEKEVPRSKTHGANKVFNEVFRLYDKFEDLFKVGGYNVSLTGRMAEELGDKLEMKDLTQDEKRALRRYTSNDYKLINNHLRNNHGMPQILKDALVTINKAMERAKLPEDVLVQRGSKWLPDDLAQMLANGDIAGLIGTILEDKGFMSTSIDAGSRFSGKYVFQIKAKKGTKGIYVADFSEFQDEYEVVLNRGTKLRILEVKKGKIDKKWHILAEVVEDE